LIADERNKDNTSEPKEKNIKQEGILGEILN
jgi:hypothetical protein